MCAKLYRIYAITVGSEHATANIKKLQSNPKALKTVKAIEELLDGNIEEFSKDIENTSEELDKKKHAQ